MEHKYIGRPNNLLVQKMYRKLLILLKTPFNLFILIQARMEIKKDKL